MNQFFPGKTDWFVFLYSLSPILIFRFYLDEGESPRYSIINQISPWIYNLPLNQMAPADPWSGVVINANISTTAHRDVGDDDFCMVLVVSDCIGGDLVFHELGLIFASRNGDASLFRSVDLTHYNLDYKGIQGSLVFHRDRAGQRWKENFNGWQNNVHFS